MTSLSINRLEELLNENGFVSQRYFVLGKYCVFIQVVENSTSMSAILTIPSKYKFKVKHGRGVYKLRAVELSKTDEEGSDTGDYTKYTGEQDEKTLEQTYTEVELVNSLSKKINKKVEDELSGESREETEKNKDWVAEYLEEGYKKNIFLSDVEKEDQKELLDVYRQVSRLKLCVVNLPYKVGILYSNFVCISDGTGYTSSSHSSSESKSNHKKGKPSIFCVRDLDKNKHRKLFVTFDLETFSSNKVTLKSDLQDVLEGIQKVLDKNQMSHTRNLNLLFSKKSRIDGHSQTILDQKNEYSSKIKKFERLYKEAVLKEEDLRDKVIAEESRSSEQPSSSSSSYELKFLKDKLTQVRDLKLKTLRNINELREKQTDISLKVDRIMFDNLVMITEILKNLDVLKRYATPSD